VPLVAEFLRKSDPVNKSSFGRCGDQWLTEQLRQRNRLRLMLCSIETYVCTYLVALDLLRYDCEVHVIADAVSSRTAENKQIGISRMQHGGAKASSTEMALFELARDATHPKFKQIAKLIKH
jgi:isochorismate hydrolase